MKKKKNALFVVILFSILVVPSFVLAVDTPIWYTVTFTGADIWAYSADIAAEARTDQADPRRYRDWTQTAGNEIQATTYGVGGLSTTGFNTWATGTGASFAFDAINLWGKGGAEAWGETYVAVPDDANNGITSWEVIQSPTGWTSGIVLANQSYNLGSGAFPVWRSGTGATLSQANMNDADFVFVFQVLISNPSLAFDGDGKLRVFFGGFNDDLQGAGPGNYEVSGAMNLAAAPVPIPGAVWLLGSGIVGLIGLKRRSNKRDVMVS